MARPSIEQACYWLASSQRTAGASLRGNDETDIAIVGAGLTGLWTAIHLKRLEPHIEVTLVEQRSVGYGASGRNAGMLMTSIDHSLSGAIQHFGLEEATRLAQLGRDNVAEMIAYLPEAGIDARVERNGALHVALAPSHLDDLRHEREAARSLGIEDLRMLDRDETLAEIRSPRYHGALFDPSTSLIDPQRLVIGLADDAAGRGCRLFEETPVTALNETGPPFGFAAAMLR